MTATPRITCRDPSLPGEDADLRTVLAAWHAATLRLEQTHETLQAEVRRLTDELEAKNRELARKNRLADLGQMAAHVAHEVRNSLVPVSLYLSLLRRRVQADADNMAILEKIESGFRALDATVHDLLHFTSDRDPQRAPFRVGELLEEIRDSLTPQWTAQSIDAMAEADPRLSMTADREMLRRALLNLVFNAMDAMPAGGRLRLGASPAGSTIRLLVADSGPGMSEEAACRAFDPFFTTKQGGTGLGLAIVERIAEVHGGTVSAENGPDGGAVFTIEIPQPASEEAR